jgi:hypothetical protein
MNWVEVEVDIEENCTITCSKCTEILIKLDNIDIYGEMTDYR